jgi:hypothetical protein
LFGFPWFLFGFPAFLYFLDIPSLLCARSFKLYRHR